MSDFDNGNLPPPVPPSVIPSIVDTLEPELAAAYRAGNPAIMQAVAAGATTTQMVVNDLIRTGASLTGLPPGVAQLVDERKKEIELKQAEEDAALKKLAAGVLGAAVMASTEAKGMYYGEGSGSERNWCNNPPSSAEFAQMNEAEKSQYFTALSQMSAADFNALSTPQFTQHAENTKTEGNDKATTGRLSIDEFTDIAESDTKLGATRAEREAATQRILAAADYNGNQKDFLEAVSKLSSAAEMEYALKLRQSMYESNFGGSAAEKAERAKRERENGNGTAGETLHDGVDDIKQIEKKKAEILEQVQKMMDARKTLDDPNSTPEQKAQATATLASYWKQSDDAAQKADRTQRAEMREVSKLDQTVSAKADAVIAKAEVKAAKADGGLSLDDDAPPAPKVAAAAPVATSAEPQRLSIDARPLAASGMLQEPGVEAQVAANDPQGPKPAPKVANGSPGMGASA